MDITNTIIRRFGRDYKITGSNKSELSYNCPFCISKRGKPDNDRKLYVNKYTGYFFCFKCHSKGRVSNNIESSYGIYDKLLNYKSYKVSDEYDQDDNMFYLPNIEISNTSVAYNYCKNRGITDDMINFYNIKLGIGNLFGRIVIPNILYGTNSLWTDMFSARTYLEQVPKYMNPNGCKKTHSVFNLHNIKKGGDIYLNEGAVTSIFAGRDSVAFYGCHPSIEQIDAVLDKNPKNIYCTLDGDTAGRYSNEKLAKILSTRSNSNVYLVYMPEDKDAANLGEEEYKRYVHNNKILYHSSVYTSVMSYFKK